MEEFTDGRLNVDFWKSRKVVFHVSWRALNVLEVKRDSYLKDRLQGLL